MLFLVTLKKCSALSEAYETQSQELAREKMANQHLSTKLKKLKEEFQAGLVSITDDIQATDVALVLVKVKF